MRLEPAEIGRIYPRHHEDRILVRLEDVPRLLIDALLAVDREHRELIRRINSSYASPRVSASGELRFLKIGTQFGDVFR